MRLFSQRGVRRRSGGVRALLVPSARSLPSYGPHGEPYSVRARFDGRDNIESHHWTEGAALEARDRAFDAGARSVHVAGLPFRGAAAGFPRREPPLPYVED